MEYSTNAKAAARALWQLGPNDLLGLDIETEGFDPYLGRIRVIQLNIKGKLYVLDASDPELPVIAALTAFPGLVLGANLKFEAKWFLCHAGINLGRCFDVFRASKLIYNGGPGTPYGQYSHTLWGIEDRELGTSDATREASGIADHSDSNWGVPFAQLTPGQLRYAASDVANLPALYTSLLSKLRDHGLMDVARIEMQVILAEAKMELAGMPLDVSLWKDRTRVDESLGRYMGTQLSKELPNPVGQMGLFEGATYWNINSPKQLIKSLNLVGCNLWVDDEDEKGNPVRKESTAEEVLARNAGQFPIVKKLLTYREYSKGSSTYGDDYLEHVHNKTGRIHASFWPFTGAGRYSCARPNLQQLPRNAAVRACFRPSNPDNVFVVCDYSQIELRIAAEVTQDPLLMAAYMDGRDVHRQTATLVTGRENPTKDDRQIAKAVNFGLLYGAGAATLVAYAQASYGVTLTLDEAKAIREKFFGAYEQLRKWHHRATSPLELRKPTRTMVGRLRYLPEDSYSDRLNSPIQGTGADMLKKAMRMASDGLPRGAAMVCCIHDEIVCETPRHMAAETVQIVKDAMETAGRSMLKRVPVIAEGGSCESWAEK